MPPTPSLLHLHRPTLRGAFITITFGACVSAMGCGGGDNNVEGDPPVIPSVTAIAPGDPTCPTGGVRVSTGVDDNRNGTLDDSEIDRTSSICNGSNLGVEDDVLVRTVTLDPGVECPDGGRRLDIGLDNGDGTGTAGNATLEDGEVDTSFLDCNDAPMVVGVQPPTGPAGSFVLDTHGGSGGTGDGGDGGDVAERGGNDTIDAFLMLSATGLADASCTAPTVTADLGSNGLDVTSDLVVPLVAMGDEATQADGAVYASLMSTRLLRWDATNAVGVPITGVRVAAGATLTLPGNSGGTGARLDTDDDVEVLGTLTTSVGGSGRLPLSVTASRVLLQSGSVVLTSGSGAGADGASINLEGRDLVVALGSLDSRGSDGPTGGDGGSVDLISGTQLFTAGTIQTQGGAGSAGDGGDGGRVFLRADSRLVCNAAAVTTDGGAATAIAGDGGEVRLGADCVYGTPLEVRSSGAIRTRGGAQMGTCDPQSCGGGSGGEISFVSGFGGSIASSGGLDTRGGNSAGAVGGSGGDVYLDEGYAFETLAVVRHYDLSGNITTFGGDGATGGGAGGDIESHNVGTLGSAVRYLGYASALLSGGQGGANGGSAGDVLSVPNGGGTNGGLGLYVFDTDVTAVGGNGGTGRGGDGGVIVFAPGLGPFPSSVSDGPPENFVFVADATLHGGNGTSGGEGGAIVAPSGCNPSVHTTGIRVSGTIDLDGGDGTTGSGGDAGEFNLATVRGPAVLAGSVSANGGASTSGTGGGFYGSVLMGTPATLSASVTAGGGASGADGGNADDVVVVSFGGSSTVTGTVTVTGGAGGTAAQNGTAGALRVDFGSACIGSDR